MSECEVIAADTERLIAHRPPVVLLLLFLVGCRVLPGSTWAHLATQPDITKKRGPKKQHRALLPAYNAHLPPTVGWLVFLMELGKR